MMPRDRSACEQLDGPKQESRGILLRDIVCGVAGAAIQHCDW